MTGVMVSTLIFYIQWPVPQCVNTIAPQRRPVEGVRGPVTAENWISS